MFLNQSFAEDGSVALNFFQFTCLDCIFLHYHFDGFSIFVYLLVQSLLDPGQASSQKDCEDEHIL